MNTKSIRILIVILFFTLSCMGDSRKDVDATNYNFGAFNGRKIKNIRYCDGCGYSGDLLILEFSDNSKLVVWAYKYNMKVLTN